VHARYDWPGTWNVCGAWWGSGCAAVDSTWCWLVMTMIGMQVLLVVLEWSSDISLTRVAGGNGGTEQW